ncbi:MAG: cytochrome c [Sulfitobacter sp.]
MSKHSTLIAATALAITAMTGVAFGDGHTDKALAAAVKARQAQMQLIGYNTGLLGEMAKGATPYDAALATSAAKNLSAAASLDRQTIWLEGSVQGTVDGTRAKADIWTNAAGFTEKATALETAADAMVTAAGTDLAALQAAMGGVGGTCKACHETYRGPKN